MGYSTPEYWRKYRADNLERRTIIERKSKLKRKYGLTEEEVIELLALQGGGCAICNAPLSYPDKFTHIDHCHKTGKVRGILCHNCNRGLGGFLDKTVLLLRAWQYLRRAE